MEANTALTELHVNAFIDGLSTTRHDKPIDMEKLDYGQWGDHTEIRPYQTLEEGILWYSSHPDIQALPESMLYPLLAHNFGIEGEMEIERILEK